MDKLTKIRITRYFRPGWWALCLLFLLRKLTWKLNWWLSDERKDPYRCCQCGSTEVQERGWVYPNQGYKYEGVCEDLRDDQNWCDQCNVYAHIRTTSSMVYDADRWWSNISLKERESITGIIQEDFVKDVSILDDEADDAFDDACNIYWHNLSAKQKILKWLEIQ